MRILALDPGKTTGAVMIEWAGEVPPDPVLVWSAQIAFDGISVFLDEHIASGLDLLVMERFVISDRTVRSSRQMEPLTVLGGATIFAQLRGIPVRMQAASDAKNAFPNEALRRWSIKGPHAKDAMRHALLACHGRGVYIPMCKTPDT